METRDSAKAPKVIGRYTLHGKIAQGGMAAVYFGRQLGAAGFSRTVAIKRLHAHLASEPDLVATILDEARMSARIHHPNVVPALDVVAEEGELLLVMEYVRGESLSRLLADEFSMDRSVPLPVASAVALDALQGLHAAHEATDEQGEPLGIVHRDVSPQNILVGADGVARIIDFGIAKAAGRIQSTGQGVIKGKWGYMAPEQVAGLEPSRAIDVYAMGVVLWELLAGRRLFWAAADAAIVAQVLEGPKRPPSHFASSVPPELDALVMRALSRDPADRFPTASDMADALVRAVPPALPKEVGVWVRGLAREALARRAAAVSEIESAFGAASRQPSSPSLARERPSHGGPAVSPHEVDPSGVHDEVPTIASQASIVSVARSRPGHAPLPRGKIALGAVLAASVLSVGLFAWRSSPVTAPATPSLPASAPPLAAPVASAAPFAAPVASASPLESLVGTGPNSSSDPVATSPPSPERSAFPSPSALPVPGEPARHGGTPARGGETGVHRVPRTTPPRRPTVRFSSPD